MKTYKYKAKKIGGETISGIQKARGKEDLARILAKENYILFETRDYSTENQVLTKLWLLDVVDDSSVLVYESDIDGNFFTYNATWSPDGRYFVFFTNPDNLELRINIQNIETSERFVFEMPCANINSLDWVTLP